MENYTSLASQEDQKRVASNGVILCLRQKGRKVPPNVDMTYPYIILTLNLNGTAHALYDMMDLRSQKNDLTVFLPGHVIRPLEFSEDYEQAWLLFDPSKYADSVLKFNSKDLELFSHAPIIHLTDEQATNLLTIVKVIDYITTRSEEELPNKHRLLEAQLTLAYELYVALRHDMDNQWQDDHKGGLFMRFCDLVVAHYKVERNVSYYAQVLGYNPRYFSKLFRSLSDGISPLEWIGNYVVTQAKQRMDANPQTTIKEIAFQLGFPDSANFCRYFKRYAGIYPQEYKCR